MTKRKPGPPISHKQIKSGRIDNLLISQDFDDRPDRPHAVMLYTPNMGDAAEHWHIPLNKPEATALRSWLNKFLEPRRPARRKRT